VGVRFRHDASAPVPRGECLLRTTVDSANHPSADCSFPGLSKRVARRGTDEWSSSIPASRDAQPIRLLHPRAGASRRGWCLTTNYSAGRDDARLPGPAKVRPYSPHADGEMTPTCRRTRVARGCQLRVTPTRACVSCHRPSPRRSAQTARPGGALRLMIVCVKGGYVKRSSP